MKNKSILTLSNSQLQAYDHTPIRNIHTKRIDTGITSINIGHTLTGDLIKGRIDKLSFVSHSTEQRNIDSLDKALKRLNSDMLYRVKHIKSNQENYGDTILIRYTNTKGRYAKPILRIEYSPRNQVRGLFDLNYPLSILPSKSLIRLFVG